MEVMTEEKKGFKRTEVGLIPEDWNVKPLGDIAEIISGGTPSKKVDEYWDGSILWCTPTDITSEKSKYLSSTNRTITEKGLANSSAALLPKGALLFCSRATIGEVKIAHKPISTNQGFKSLIPFQDIDNEFLYYLVSTSKQKFIERSFGSTFLEISKKNISEIVFAIPPFAEQQAIATALSDVDELIRSLDGLIQKKEAIKKGTMQQLLSGKKRLPGFDGEWEVKALGEVCQIISGGTPSTRNSKYWDGEIKWCTPTDITKTKYKYLESTARKISSEGLKNSSATLLPEGTLLLCSRATVGEVKIATNEISTNQGFKSLICSDSVDNEYLFYLINLNKQKFIDKAFGSTFLEISKKNTADIEFEFPSVEEQKAIAEILSDMDEELQALRRKREKMVRVKEGMMQQLLTGRIRILGIEG